MASEWDIHPPLIGLAATRRPKRSLFPRRFGKRPLPVFRMRNCPSLGGLGQFAKVTDKLPARGEWAGISTLFSLHQTRTATVAFRLVATFSRNIFRKVGDRADGLQKVSSDISVFITEIYLSNRPAGCRAFRCAGTLASSFGKNWQFIDRCVQKWTEPVCRISHYIDCLPGT